MASPGFTSVYFENESNVMEQAQLASVFVNNARDQMQESHSKLSLDNKVTIYERILKPIRTYGIQLYGYTYKH